MKSILIVDDEKEICESIKMILEYEGYHVEYTTDSHEGLEKLRGSSFDSMLLDIQMPGLTGFEVLDWIMENGIDINVVMISAFNSLENAVKATKLGAFDFIEKPIDRDKLLISIRNASNLSNLKKQNKQLKENLSQENEILGESTGIKLILDTITRVAKTEARVLVTGENGTGKELVAREIHKQSNRSENEIVEVNCAAIPNELIESELFGHEKGSFTGAHQKRIGKFEQAHRGTLFLDEIGDMSLQAQAKVLRAIEDGKIQRVGGLQKIEVDVRIVAATNKNLTEEIKNERFREDLYHRLNVIPINVPPLRERRSDIPILAEHFMQGYSNKNKLPAKKFRNEALEALKKSDWTGNVRELRNMIERLLIMIPGNEITAADINSFLPGTKSSTDNLLSVSNNFQEFKEAAESAFIQKQLNENDWNISKTAELLDIQRSHLYSKIKKYNLEKGHE
ncbi:MAG: sigma-54-dependent Fis family transcriptional regulator [Melioribacteraceae bacterium]|nr:sigma-54-dependent Fis family transcriptional regulator [Melioribacteraceae bacterium]